MPAANLKLLVTRTYREWSDDQASRHAASLAYYTALSIAPIIVVAIGVAGLVFGHDAARSAILGQFSDMIGGGAADTVASMVDSAAKPSRGIIATVLGIVVLLFGASGVFSELQKSLDTIWEVAPKPGMSIWRIIRQRFLSVSMVLGVAFLLLVSLVLSAGLAALGRFVAGEAATAFLWQLVHFVVSTAITAVLFALLFKVLPDAKVRWRDVWVGAVVTAVLFGLGKLGIGLYIGRAAVASHYGAAGSIVVMLVWVYYSAQILFFGAEFTQVYARLYGAKIEPKKDAVVVPDRSEPSPAYRPAESH